MHDIEPYHRWRDFYIAAEDAQSPFFGTVSSEFEFTNAIYNYYIHPQWDEFGSQTLYVKQLFTDYEEGFVILELIGEWNDAIYNDVMFFKENVLQPIMAEGITRFILLCENVLSFHGSDDAYYEEWKEEIRDEDPEAWIVLMDVRPHVEEELEATRLQSYLLFGGFYNEIQWRKLLPMDLFRFIDTIARQRLVH